MTGSGGLTLFGFVLVLFTGFAALSVYRGKQRLAAELEVSKIAVGRQQHLLRILRLVGSCQLAIIRSRREEGLFAEICALIVDNGYLSASISAAANDAPLAQCAAPIAERENFSKTGRVPDCPSTIALPLISHGQTLAVLTISSAEAFISEELAVLGDLASSLAAGIEALRLDALNAVAKIELEVQQRKLEQRLRERTAELAAAQAETECANTMQPRFLAAASHELRQPLAALSLYVGVLAERGSRGDDRLLANMKNCVASVHEMLSKLLDLAQLDAGVVVPKVGDFPVDALIANIVSARTTEASLKKLSLRFGCSNLIGRTDSVLFQRILENFVANAVRYTDRGGVLIACRRVQGKLWVEVWDTGVGIPAARVAAIFDEYRQRGKPAHVRGKGRGLGLTIAARSAALLGLQLRVRSRPGKGSLFAVELPTAAAVSAPVSGRKAPRLEKAGARLSASSPRRSPVS